MNADRERLLELLADQAVFGLSEAEQSELTRLQRSMGATPEIDMESMERVAALLELSNVPEQLVEMPDILKSKVRSGMRDFVRDKNVAAPPAISPRSATPSRNWRSQLVAWSGWIVAAVLLLSFVFPRNQPGKMASPAKQREELLSQAGDIVQREWQPANHESGAVAKGDVVWSNAAQQGFMRLQDLAANDPTVNQYQLWIFDASQEHPVDGGVFDVPPGVGEVIIPITPKLHVSQPTTFAITVEKPGGVVVSDQKRIPLIAPI